MYYECADQSGNYPWCATSVYQSSYDYYSYKYCTAEDLGYGSNGHGEASYGEGSTVTGETCVPMTYGGVYVEDCTDDTYSSYSWCATSTTSSGTYSTWQYCGYGNSNLDNCVFPFTYAGVSYTSCTSEGSSGWCATSAYRNTKEYYSWKYCDESDYATTESSQSSQTNNNNGNGFGSGTQTVSGEECIFPFSYKGVLYYQCTTKDFGSIPWCATRVDSYMEVDEWNYCKESTSSGTGSDNQSNYDDESAVEDEDVEYRALECSKDMASQTLVWLTSPGDPIGEKDI